MMNKDIEVNTDNYTIVIWGDRGVFEHIYYGEELGGGLWFEEEEKELIDYDGVSILPKEVKDKLEELGYIVP